MGVISIHVPKTGGTSIRRAIEQSSICGDCVFSYDDDPVDRDSPTRRGLSSARIEAEHMIGNSPTVVHGHFRAAKFLDATGSERFDFFAMLREPVSWIVSLHEYWSHLADMGHGGHTIFQEFSETRPSVVELAKIPEIRWIFSRSYFEGCDREDFTFVGTQERWDESRRALSILTGAELEPMAVNVTPRSRQSLPVSLPERIELRRLLAEQIDFYREWTDPGGRSEDQRVIQQLAA